jgi:lipopolysaccharide export system permease protein
LKRLHKLLLKEFAKPLVATFFVALFILILQFLWKRIDELAGKGLEWDVIAELLLYASAGLVPLALPLAVLLSSIMTFGNLGENLELTAIKSSGISLQQFMKPLIILTTVIGIGAFFYSNLAIPYTNLKAMSLLYDIKKQRQQLQIREGVFYNDIEGYSIKVGEKNPRTNLMKDIMIYQHDQQQGNAEVTVADSGYIKMTSEETRLLVILYNGQTYKEMEESKKSRARREPKKYPHQVRKFDKETLLMDISGFNFTRTDEELFKDNYQMLKLSQLKANKDSLVHTYNQKAHELAQKLGNNLYLERNPSQSQSKEQKPDSEKPSHDKPQKVPGDAQAPPKKPHPNIDTNNSYMNDSLQGLDSLARARADSLQRVRDSFNLERLYDTLPPDTKISVLRIALNNARRNSKSISNSRKIFEHREKNIYKHQIHWHKKLTLSFACIIFFFIGAPLGSIIRKGGLGTPLVISVLFFIIYYIISITGENFVEKGVLPATFGMWLSSLIFLPIGIFLTYKATNDSVILSSETYLRVIKKMLGIRSKDKKAREEADQR